MAINNFNVGVGTTSQLTRYRYVATGGETSISGTDADGKTLSYTVGLEQVFLNGVNLVRGQDYTATNGTTISNLTALVASDSLEVFAYVPFNIANAVTASTVDAKGDLLVGTGADTVGRLAVGTTNNQELIVDSSTATGLRWGPPSGLVFLNTTSFSAVSSVSLPANTFTSTYDHYRFHLYFVHSTTTSLYLRFRASGSDASSGYAQSGWSYKADGATSVFGNSASKADILLAGDNDTNANFVAGDFMNPYLAKNTAAIFQGNSDYQFKGFNANGVLKNTTIYDSATIFVTTGTVTGIWSIYGYNK